MRLQTMSQECVDDSHVRVVNKRESTKLREFMAYRTKVGNIALASIVSAKSREVRENAHNALEKVVCDDTRTSVLERYILKWACEGIGLEHKTQSLDDVLCRRRYTRKTRDIISNLTNKNNQKFQDAFHSHEISAKVLPYMSNYDMFPELTDTIREKQYNKWLKNYIMDKKAEQCESGMFKCPKCKHNATTYYSMQTRSADEPMTNFITCLKCGNHWKD